MTGTIGRRGLLISGGALAAAPVSGSATTASANGRDHRVRTGADVAAARPWRTGDNPPGRWIDLLTGSGRFRTHLDAGDSAQAIMASWQEELKAFDRRRRPSLLYRRDR